MRRHAARSATPAHARFSTVAPLNESFWQRAASARRSQMPDDARPRAVIAGVATRLVSGLEIAPRRNHRPPNVRTPMRTCFPFLMASLGLVTSFAATASAHIRLLSPAPRYEVQGEVGIKSCPCGL